MKGAVLAWLNSVSSAVPSACAPGVLPAMVVPRKLASIVECLAAVNAIGLRNLTGLVPLTWPVVSQL